MARNLDNLTIHAFRGLRELELTELGGINLFVGPNNSGKTSALEAIATFSRPLDPQEWVRAVRRREIRAAGSAVVEGLRWMFPQTERLSPGAAFSGGTVITGTGRFPVLEAQASGVDAVFVGPETDWTNEIDVEATDADYDERPGMTLQLSARMVSQHHNGAGGMNGRSYDLLAGRFSRVQGSPTDPALPVQTVSPFAHRVEQLQVSQLTESRLQDRKEQLIEILRGFDDQIRDLEILSRAGIRPTIYVKHGRLGLAPLSTFGDGLRRALTIALGVLAVQNGNLLIDEIESSIHVSALTPVFTWLVQACAKYNVQLFATTHSLDAVDALLSACEETDIGQVVGYHLDSTPEKSVARRLDGDLLHRLRYKRGLDVR